MNDYKILAETLEAMAILAEDTYGRGMRTLKDAAKALREADTFRAQLSEAQARLACAAKWTKDQPTAPGAYWVRGWMFGDPSLEALVEVCLDETLADEAEGSILVCNLHERNSDTNIESWSPVSSMSCKFEWLGPLYAAPVSPAAQEAQAAQCAWYENGDGLYNTGCGHQFEFIDGGPADNGAEFCQYCGKKIDQHYYDDCQDGE